MRSMRQGLVASHPGSALQGNPQGSQQGMQREQCQRTVVTGGERLLVVGGAAARDWPIRLGGGWRGGQRDGRGPSYSVLCLHGAVHGLQANRGRPTTEPIIDTSVTIHLVLTALVLACLCPESCCVSGSVRAARPRCGSDQLTRKPTSDESHLGSPVTGKHADTGAPGDGTEVP